MSGLSAKSTPVVAGSVQRLGATYANLIFLLKKFFGPHKEAAAADEKTQHTSQRARVPERKSDSEGE